MLVTALAPFFAANCCGLGRTPEGCASPAKKCALPLEFFTGGLYHIFKNLPILYMEKRYVIYSVCGEIM